MAVSTPIGTDITVARPTCSSVPMMAWYAPPNASSGPTAFMEWLKKSASNRLSPLLITSQSRRPAG